MGVVLVLEEGGLLFFVGVFFNTIYYIHLEEMQDGNQL